MGARTTQWRTISAGNITLETILGQKCLLSLSMRKIQICIFIPFFFRERHFGSVVAASGSLVLLGGRDGSAQPMATGDIEQFDVEQFSWHPVKTKMTMERSYQCAVSLAR